MRRAIPIRVLKGAIVLLAALAAAELFLRLTSQQEIIFETWCTPGMHTSDHEFGFVFTGNYRGYMRHRDRVWSVPLRLDDHGFRLPNLNKRQGPARRVVVIGGASMMMSYGLPDHKTVTGQIARASKTNLQIRNLAWAGFDVYRTWHVYRDKLGETIKPELAVIAVYARSPEDFADLPADFDRPRPAPPPEQLFRIMDGLVVRPRGRLAAALGRNAYRSFLLFRLVRLADRCLAAIGANPPHDPQPAAAPLGQDPIAIGQARFAGFLRHLQGHFADRGTKILVVFLPKRNAAKDSYRALSAVVPRSIPRVDLHQRLYGKLRYEEFIAAGHYGPGQAELIGKELAREVDRLLQTPEGKDPTPTAYEPATRAGQPRHRLQGSR